MGNTTAGTVMKSVNSYMQGAGGNDNIEEKLPEGDKFFGFLNVFRSVNILIGIEYLLCKFSNPSSLSL